MMLDLFDAYEKHVHAEPAEPKADDTLFDIPAEEEKAPVVSTTEKATPTGNVDNGALAAEVAKIVLAQLEAAGVVPKSEEGGEDKNGD